MNITDADIEVLVQLRQHYYDRARQAEFQARLPDRNRLFAAQGKRDRSRADALGRVIEAISNHYILNPNDRPTDSSSTCGHPSDS